MRLFIIIILLAPLTNTAWAQTPPQLRHNPFARPDMTPTRTASSDEAGGWPEELRATLVDGPRSLANIDGALVGVGEKIDGATVSEIGEGVVTLVRGETSRVLRLEDEVSTDTRRDARE